MAHRVNTAFFKNSDGIKKMQGEQIVSEMTGECSLFSGVLVST